jgi:pimeloyl-ACP methyl ester carboxylesterase
VNPTRTLIAAGLAGVAGAAAALWAYPRWLVSRSEDVDLADAAKPGEVVNLKGLAIHYLEQGRGPALMLIHGLGGCTYNFRHNVAELSRHLRVIALDLKGFGYSERPTGADYSPSAQAGLVADLMDHLAIPQAAVLGHSLGGVIALHLAAMEPERVEKLILVGSAHPNRLVPSVAASPPGQALLRLGTAVVLHNPRLREMALRMGYYDSAFLTQEAMEEFVRHSRIRGSVDAVVSTLCDAAREAPLDLWRVRQPTILLWGEGDHWTDLGVARSLERQLPNARLRAIGRARHMVLEEQADESNEAILAFLLEGMVDVASGAAQASE